jgi:peptide/nickel transport system substrate-binding protein
MRTLWYCAAIAVILIAGCSPVGERPSPADTAVRPNAARTLTFLVKVEPVHIGPLDGAASAFSSDVIEGLFRAALTQRDQFRVPQPELAEALPQLNTDTWKVFPDGQMETTYRLRPNLTWQDGEPLTAEDFVFTIRVHQEPGMQTLFGQSRVVTGAILSVTHPDERTVVFRWKEPTVLAEGGIPPPLPRHILEGPFNEDPARLVGHPYWTTQYVGVGPYRLDRWEAGAFIEASASDNYALGRPKIDRVKVIWAGDPSVAMANLIGGNADIAADQSLRFEQGALLRRQLWANGGGNVLFTSDTTRYLQIEFRPDLVNPRALLDLRVRKALAYAMDKQGFVDGLLEGQGLTADSLALRDSSWYPEAERAMTKYPYDLRQAEQLMNAAGFLKGPDGMYITAGGESFAPEVRGEQQNEVVILVDGWKRAGMNAQLTISTPQQASDNEYRSTFPAMAITKLTVFQDDTVAKKFASSLIAAPENRWSGTNRGGYSNPEYDRLTDVFLAALDRSERDKLMAQIVNFQTEDLPALPMYYDVFTTAHVDALHGPLAAGYFWNIHQWEWRP